LIEEIWSVASGTTTSDIFKKLMFVAGTPRNKGSKPPESDHKTLSRLKRNMSPVLKLLPITKAVAVPRNETTALFVVVTALITDTAAISKKKTFIFVTTRKGVGQNKLTTTYQENDGCPVIYFTVRASS
jgi:hypothetical protein